jgi:hypothetical protein
MMTSELKEAPLMSMQDTQKLLAELRQLLTTHAVEPWASRVTDLEARFHKAVTLEREWAVRAVSGEIASLLHGGPGTLHRLAIRRELGDCIEENEEEAANARLTLLRTQLTEATSEHAKSTSA